MRNNISPSHMGRCDNCGDIIDLDHSDDRLIEINLNDFNISSENISQEQIKDSILDALDKSDNLVDDMIAKSFREKSHVKIHKRCWDKCSLYGDIITTEVESGDEDEK